MAFIGVLCHANALAHATVSVRCEIQGFISN